MKKLILTVACLACAAAGAQQLNQKPTVETVSRLAKDSRPVPGIFCGQERTLSTFDEYSYTGVDQALVTQENVRRCLRSLPKRFTRTTEQVLGLMVEDLRGDEVPGLGCSIVKPVGKPYQYKIWFVIPQLLKQEQIDECFRKALSGPNRAQQASMRDV